MTAHNARIDKKKLTKWLAESSNAHAVDYHHLLLSAADGNTWQSLIKELKLYFESAHLDSRKHFHNFASIDLHATATSGTTATVYPNSLPRMAQKAFFGEIFCGLVAEHYALVGGKTWVVPVFLLRNHDVAKYYLKKLVRKVRVSKEIPGRHGDDFIALEVDSTGTVAGALVAEAKYRATLNTSVYNGLLNGIKTKTGGTKSGILEDLNDSHSIPDDLKTIAEILHEIDKNKYASIINSIEQIELSGSSSSIRRTDMFVIIGAKLPKKHKPPFLATKKKPTNYTQKRDLQAVEIVIPDAENLIQSLYNSLYQP